MILLRGNHWDLPSIGRSAIFHQVAERGSDLSYDDHHGFPRDRNKRHVSGPEPGTQTGTWQHTETNNNYIERYNKCKHIFFGKI